MGVLDKLARGRATLAVLFALSALVGGPTGCGRKETSAVGAGDPWTTEQVLDAAGLANVVSSPSDRHPLVLYVGPAVLYRRAHIPGALYIGPAAEPDGAANLRKEMQSTARDRELVVYCGCCPWKACPNVRPAVKALQDMGFTSVNVLHLPHSFRQDWINKGYAAQKGELH